MTDVDIQGLFAQGIGEFWWAIPLAILWFVVGTRWFKGNLGEFLVARSLEGGLDPKIYTVLHDVTLPVPNGTTQIDHIVISPSGVFVIETKNMGGWIFGSEANRYWTQTFHRKKFRFQNPLRQNYKHLKAVASVTGLPEGKLHSVVIFTGAAKFKTAMPPNVTRRAGGVSYIRARRQPSLSESEIAATVLAIKSNNLQPGARTNRSHVRNLNKQKEQPSCPKCGSVMVKRTTRRGANAGRQFWGCSAFPQCKSTRPVSR